MSYKTDFKTSPKQYTSEEFERMGKQALALRRISQALANGTISRAEKCALCGTVCKTVAHHHKGYDFPFDVWWICYKCNGNLRVHDGSMTMEQARAYLFAKKDGWQNYYSNKSREIMDCVICGISDERRNMRHLDDWDECACVNCADKLLGK